MKKRDKKQENKQIIQALAMVTQIGLSMLTCMGISLAIGYYLDQRLGTKCWVIIMLIIGILAAIRSLFILTGKIPSLEETQQNQEEQNHEGSEKDTP